MINVPAYILKSCDLQEYSYMIKFALNRNKENLEVCTIFLADIFTTPKYIEREYFVKPR